MSTKTTTHPLTSMAMLVCMETHTWGNRKMEVDFTAKIAAEAKTDTGMIRTTKKLVGRDQITVVTSAFSRYKAHHYENTLPWLDNGYRMLPSKNYLSYIAQERKLADEIDAGVESFLKVYPKVREEAAKRLGDAFNDDDYPTPAELRHKWRVSVHFTPVPDKADFRVDVPAAELKRINADIDGQVKQALENATRDLFERLYKVVLALQTKLKGYKATTTKGKRSVEGAFRDSIISNIRELCEMLPRLNITGNKDLARIAAEVNKTLAKKNPAALRDDDSLRKETIAQADNILAAMADYVGA